MSFDVKAGLLQGFCLDFCEENQMAVKVMIPTPLRVYAGKRDSAEFTAATVGEALGHLTTQFGDLRKHLFTEDGKLRSFVNVYVNDEDIRYLAKENTPTKDGDTISIVPSLAGGSSPYNCCPASYCC
jgi:adenylyltransferase/sulfurtransferase